MIFLCGRAVLEAFLLSASVCADTLVAAVSYGARKIRISRRAGLVLCTVSTAVLTLSSAVGTAVRGGRILAFVLLFAMGAVRLFDGTLKGWIRRCQGRGQVRFSALQLHFLLEVYADPQLADTDGEGELSAREAVVLSLALSADGAAAGFGAGSGGVSVMLTALFSFLLCAAAVFGGVALGSGASRLRRVDLTAAGGVLMILLGVSKLLI